MHVPQPRNQELSPGRNQGDVMGKDRMTSHHLDDPALGNDDGLIRLDRSGFQADDRDPGKRHPGEGRWWGGLGPQQRGEQQRGANPPPVAKSPRVSHGDRGTWAYRVTWASDCWTDT